MFHDGMYGICQSDGILDTIIGSYTIAEEHKAVDTYILGSGYQGLIKPHPSKAFVAYVSTVHDLVEVIDCSNNDYIIKRFHGGDFPDLRVENDMAIMALSRNHPWSFMDLCTTESYLYAIYSGKNYAESESATANCNLLYVFDWDLNPIICYELDYEITAIKVTEDDKILYSFALNKDDKMALIHWNLNH